LDQHLTLDRQLPRVYVITIRAAFLDVMRALHILTLGRLALIVAMVATPIAAFAQGTGPRWTLQNRPFMDGSKPAISA